MTAAEQADPTFDILNYCINTLGVAVFPLWGLDAEGNCLCPKGAACKAARNAGKHPYYKFAPNGFKNATRDTSLVRQWVRQAPQCNWAMRCGEPMPGGGFLGVLDLDPRNGSEETIQSVRSRGDELPETVTQCTGGGGNHLLYRFPKLPASWSPGPGLDFQGAGKYVVIAPSRHYTGGVYAWDLGLGPNEIDVADAPAWLVAGTDEAVERPSRDGEDTARQTVLGEAFALAGRAGGVMPSGEMYVNCPQSHLHSDARGRGEDASTVVLPPAGGSRFGGFSCRHGHCANLKWKQVLDLLPKELVEQAQRKYPMLAVVAQPAATEDEGVPESRPADGDLDEPAPGHDGITTKQLREIQQRLNYKTIGKNFKITSDIVNVNILLTYDPRWQGVLKWDDFAQQLRFMRDPPWHVDDAPKETSDVWMDVHVTCLDLWLRRNWAIELAAEKIREAVYVVGRRDAVSPLRDYLEGLTWDGTKRVDDWLISYLGAANNPYHRSVGRKWMLSAVARAYVPGCKVDTLIVLEGPQGKGKSTALRKLAPQPSWFSDTPIDIGNKDAYVALRGKWIIELAELASLKKADLDRAKAFFSSPVDSYRPPYGREQITVPRTAVFAGTVNPDEYLNDATGARRFWPVRIGAMDIEALERDRDQLWAEVVTIYKDWVSRGAKQSECLWWPTPEELAAFEAAQAEREVAQPWTEAIAIWTKSERCKSIVASRGYVLSRDVAIGALDLADKDLTTGVMTSIGIIMKRELGWSKNRMTIAGGRAWAYSPPTRPSAE